MRYGTGMALVLLAGVFWSFQALMIRQIADASAWTIMFWRSLAMLPVVLTFIGWRAGDSPWPAIRKAGMAGVLGGIGLVVAMGGSILSFQTTTVANAAFLLAASPFLSALLARAVLGERVAPRTWAAIALALVGIFIMVRDGLAAGAWVGNVAALAAALGFAAFTVALRWRRLDDNLPTVVLGAAFSIIAGVIITRQLGQPLAVSAADLLWCMLMGMVTLSGGMILYATGSRTVPSAELALLSNTEVLLAPFWVWLLMREVASSGTFLGGAILLAAILFNATGGRRQPIPA